MKTDELDRKLLGMLARDGRVSSAEMARKVGESERKVVYRVNNLLESDVVSVRGVINPKAFGYEVMADIYCEAELGKIEEIVHRVAGFPEIRYAQTTFGDHDVGFQVLTRTSTDLYQFVIQKLAQVPGITKTRTSIVPLVVKDIHEWIPVEVLEAE